MSLFIDALAKKIICYMEYKDNEINILKTKLEELKYLSNKGFQVCDRRHYEDFYCISCQFESCMNCADDNWIFTKLNKNGAGDVIIDDRR